jgi:hypothetical protein
MKNMKMGYIVKILSEDNLGIIREESTLTEWLFFLDETKEKFQVGTAVGFYRNDEYEQFVAEDISRINTVQSKRVS